jgi:hypothetical protein
MAGDVQLIALSARKAAVLAKLLAAFEPIVDDLARANTVILGLRLADGSSRTVKLIATSLNDSAPPEQAGGTGGLPPGGDVGDIIVKQSSADGDADWEPPSGGGASARVFTVGLSPTEIVPTTEEISAAIEAAYATASTTPQAQDLIILTVDGTPALAYTIRTSGVTASGLFVRDFSITIESTPTTFYAIGWQLGLAFPPEAE